MGNWLFWIFILSAVISPLFYAASSLRYFFISWRIPTTWISALPDKGWVEVTGKIRADTVKSLLRKVDCAFWQLEVLEYQGGNRGGGRWKPILKKSSGSFLLDDLTGRINIQDGKPVMVTNNEYRIDRLDEDTRALLESIGVKTKGFLGFDKRLRVFERTVGLDDDLMVVGKLQKSATPVTIFGNEIVPYVISNMGRAEMNKTLFMNSIRPMILPYLIGFAFLVYFLYEFIK